VVSIVLFGYCFVTEKTDNEDKIENETEIKLCLVIMYKKMIIYVSYLVMVDKIK
jgi:glucose uptake protein GlcU